MEKAADLPSFLTGSKYSARLMNFKGVFYRPGGTSVEMN
jgi:hypothetical protein